MQSLSGEGGIRTLEQVAPLLDFESSAFNHSATSPYVIGFGHKPSRHKLLDKGSRPRIRIPP